MLHHVLYEIGYQKPEPSEKFWDLLVTWVRYILEANFQLAVGVSRASERKSMPVVEIMRKTK